MRVLVTGANGQLGQDLVSHLQSRRGPFGEPLEVFALDHKACDVSDRHAVARAVGGLRPDVVVNAAAWTAVDACESDPERAYKVNALGVRWLREAAEACGAHLCTISTDYVFSGDKSSPYTEWDEPGPRSVYGASKLAGEKEAGGDATIVRTSWVCGLGGSNMVKTVLSLIEQGKPMRFVDDQRGCPTFTPGLAVKVAELALEAVPGIFHVTHQGAVSWYEFVQAILEAAKADPGMVEPISTADLDPPRPAPRPANSVLDNAALRLGGFELLPDFHEPLAEMVDSLIRRRA
jgi:dTDP-4-dehydrorhamnose reductase